MRILQITFLTVAMILSAADPLGLHAAMIEGGAVRVSAKADSCWGTRSAVLSLRSPVPSPGREALELSSPGPGTWDR